MSTAVARHRTALKRAELSRPLRTAVADGVLRPSDAVMDYGCGHGGDVRRLISLGYDCSGWDPVHAPEGRRCEADLVNLGYVVNVIERPTERVEALRSAWALARRVLVVSARLVAETPAASATSPFADGLLTRLGTFQKFYEQQELRTWIEQALDVATVAGGPGVIYVFREASERAAFLASRVRRASPQRPRVGERLRSEHRPLLDALAAFMIVRGRLPDRDELAQYDEIEAKLGSVSRAYRILQLAGAGPDVARVRAARSEDVLLYLALAKFEGRPKLNELPLELQLDVKAFFGTYGKACERADELLFALGRPGQLEAAIAAAGVGKRMPNALYVHLTAVAELPLALRLYEGCARTYAGTPPDANIVKLGRTEPKISYLSYPTFDKDPHPSLASSVAVHLQTFRVRERSYAQHKNPPILHRKEEFVGETYPQRSKFANLTRTEEAKGLYDDPSAIGTRDGWERILSETGVTLRGHRLIRRHEGSPPFDSRHWPR